MQEEAVIEATTESTPQEGAAPAPADNAGLLDLGQYGDMLVEITVDGETTQVPLREAASGYMRQSAFTRKTQDLANQRKELEPYVEVVRAFEQDPEAATVALANYYGFDPMGQQPQQQPQQDPYSWDDDDSTSQPARPSAADQEIEQLKRQVRALTANQSEQFIDKEAAALVDRYPGIDPAEVKRHAIQNKLPTLEVAARDLLFDDRNEAWQNLQERRAAEKEIVESKKSAGVVNPGSGPALGSTSAPPKSGKYASFADAFQETLAENNMSLSDF